MHHTSCVGDEDDEVVLIDDVETDSKSGDAGELDLSEERISDVEKAKTQGKAIPNLQMKERIMSLK